MNLNKLNKDNQNKIATKGQLKFIIATDLLIFATIGVIIYEIYKKKTHFASYIMLGLVFICMGINQYIYYKNNGGKKYLFMMSIYGLIGIGLIIFRLFI